MGRKQYAQKWIAKMNLKSGIKSISKMDLKSISETLAIKKGKNN
jgi:hypothetical protein